MLMMRRLSGDASLAKLGEEFNLDPRTVQRRLSLARDLGVLAEARKVFVSEMLPQSMAVLQEALDGDDLRLATMVALKVVEGLRAIEGGTATPSSAAAGVEETFERFRERIIVKRTATDVKADPPAAASPAENISVSGPGPLSLRSASELPSHEPAKTEAPPLS